MVLTTELRWCGACATDAVFDRFDCPDHDDGCLELVCTMCGSGLERVDVLDRVDPSAGPAAAPGGARVAAA